MAFQDIKTKPKILIGVLSPLLLLLALGGVAVYSINSMLTTTKQVEHTYDVLSEAASVVGSAVDMETGMRGYLLAGEEGFLDPYKGGEKATYSTIDKLKQTVSDNPGQVARLDEVATTLKAWQSDVTEPTIGLRRQIGDAKTMNDMAALVGEARGKVYFDKFRGQIATFIEREQSLLIKRERDFQNLLKSASVNSATAKKNVGWVSHTYKVIAKANDILAAAVDMETGMRGYLLAGKEGFLDPYKAGKEKFDTLVAEMKETVSDNPAQVKLMNEISDNIHAWIADVTEPTIQLRRDIGDAKTMDDMADLIGEARGKVYFDKFRQIMTDFQAEEAGLMDVRKADNAEMVGFAFTMIAICIIVAVIIGVALAFVIGGAIANPISKMTSSMRVLAEGDKSVEIPGTGRGDEIGDMAEAVQVFKDNMIKADNLAAEQEASRAEREQRAEAVEKLTHNFDSDVSGVIETVAASATEMDSTASSMSATAEQTSSQSTMAAAASEEASANVQTVASAAEELSSSISEISRQVAQSTQISATAVAEVEGANEQVQGLADSAQKIGEVVALITDIADQTNLLALNATIEAARAGEAGKGFAVVASEVKNLANATAKATEEISAQIGDIQSSTQDAVHAIDSIGGIIREMNEISSTIAAAVEEQGAATQEIARNVEEASTGTAEVSSNVASVTQAAGETGQAAGTVREAAQDLSTQTETLKGIVEKFLGDVRAV
ncbi:CHASE3 domain-containing protein [Pseudomonadota bacterium]